MERLYIIAPALIPAAYMLSMFAYFSWKTALSRQPAVDGLNRRKFTNIIGPFLTAYFLWLLNPIERAMKGRIPPNAVTAGSLAFCAIGGAALVGGYLAAAAWAYIAAGALDVLDGRLARATNSCSKAGAFLDSVSDRWGELFIFAGAAWFLRETPWLGAVMLAVSGSLMVSYTRARGEGLGLKLDGGTMQRAERVLIVAVGMLIAAWFGAAEQTASYSTHIIGAALLITGLGSTATSLSRWRTGYLQLEARDATAKAPIQVEPAAPSGHVLIPFESEPSERSKSPNDNGSNGSKVIAPAIVVATKPQSNKEHQPWASAGALESSVQGPARD